MSLAAAAAAAPLLAALPRGVRAAAMVAAADALEAGGDELVPIATAETGLTEVRLRGELRRTAVQLRLLADVTATGTALDPRVDEADPAFVLGSRPDLRRTHVPLGPALVFAAGNFPFAFSVAGGDTAAALAAGCPVVVKAHPGHPALSRRTAEVVGAALVTAGLPDGVLTLIEGEQAGIDALRDPLLKVASFTGSRAGGQALARIAAERPVPVPFYGELGSVNPVVVTAAAVAERADAIAAGFVTSVTGSAGQLCTKPGFLLVPGEELDDRIAAAAAAVDGQRLLSAPITAGYASRRDSILGTPGVRVLAEGAVETGEDGVGRARPTIVAAPLEVLLAQREHLLDEAFGPLSVVVDVPADADLADVLPDLFPGELTAGVHLGAAERAAVTPALQRLVAVLTAIAGRVLFDGWPTGVAVTAAMQHGGPWPATTLDATSVGTAAIGRFQRAVAFQDAPTWALPPELRDAGDAPRTVDAAGGSATWGVRAAD